MTKYSIRVPGNPVGKGRPRMTVQGGHARAYTPDKTVKYENLVRTTFVSEYPDFVPLDKPIVVTVWAKFPIPESWSKKKKDLAFFYDKKPDVDNVVKSVFDGLNGVAWTDDKLICELRAFKTYTRLMPECFIEIQTAEELMDKLNE